MNDLKQELIGQREGLQYALDIAKMNIKTLEDMIANIDKTLNKM